jgi:lysophospholipase L1-like esterase
MFAGRPRCNRAAAIVGFAALCVGLLTSCGSRDPKTGATGGIYLALGDSLAFGYRPAGARPAPDYHDPASFVGYPEIVGAALKLRVVNASCPGETIASMISTTAPSYGCESTARQPGGYRTAFPLHIRYSGSQLAFAVGYLEHHRDQVRLVTIDIGANDVGVCVAITVDKCGSTTDQRSLEYEIGSGLEQIYRSIRDTAGYHGRIVAVTYYPDNFNIHAEVQIAQALNRIVVDVTGPFGGRIADGYSVFEKASRAAGGNPCDAGLLVALPGGSCDQHPSARGQRLLASAVEAAVRS